MTMSLIETKTLGSAAASIEFTNIPQDGTDLLIVTSLRGDTGTDFSAYNLQFNSNSSNYAFRYLLGNGSSASSSSGSSLSSLRVGNLVGAAQTANTFDNTSIYVTNYTAANNKSVSIDNVGENNQTFSIQAITAGLWSNTAAITSVKFEISGGASFATNSMISLYKITKA